MPPTIQCPSATPRGSISPCRERRSRRWRRGLATVTAALSIGLAPHGASAQPRGGSDGGRDLEAGAEQFRQGHYDDAITLFRAAYIHSRQPYLLFNIAVAYERIGDRPHALDFYRQYAAALPLTDREGRARSDEAIARFSAPATSAVNPTTNVASTSPTTEPRGNARPTRGVSPLLVAGGAVTVAGAVAASVLWAVTDTEVRGYTARCVDTTTPPAQCGADYGAVRGDANTRAIVVDVLWGVTGLAAAVTAVGVYLTVRDPGRADARPRAQLIVGPSYAGVSCAF
ncbi:MAG: hypothetical protein WCJ30_06375 [Deltaproteobacteria bacterium]